MMKIFKIYSLSNFEVLNSVLLTIITILYLRSLEPPYNWMFILFDQHHFFPKTQDLSLITRKYQVNPNGRTFFKITHQYPVSEIK